MIYDQQLIWFSFKPKIFKSPACLRVTNSSLPSKVVFLILSVVSIHILRT